MKTLITRNLVSLNTKLNAAKRSTRGDISMETLGRWILIAVAIGILITILTVAVPDFFDKLIAKFTALLDLTPGS